MSLDGWLAQLLLMIGAFALATAIAAAAGAANLGTAMTVGVLAFAATYVWLIAKR